MLTVILIIILLTGSALFSGLRLGLLSLSLDELRRQSQQGSPDAKQLYPLLRCKNQLLVTLILLSVLTNTLLVIVLYQTRDGFTAFIIGFILVLIFGELIPRATVNKFSLQIGSFFVPAIDRMMWVFSPLASPLGKLLDRAQGEEQPVIYSKEELLQIIEENCESENSDIVHDELRIVEHALSFGDKPIDTVMTPRSMIASVDKDEKIHLEFIEDLHNSGHSRFPVTVEDNLDDIVGTLYLRDLVERTGQVKIETLMSRDVYYVSDTETLDHVLNAFLKTKHHMFIVVNEFGETVGLVTIEDIIEQILGRKIVDEFDRYDDLRAVAKKNAKNSSSQIEDSK